MKISRRNFVASLGGLSLASIATSVPTIAIAGETDYRALVCINLAGGNDAVNTIVPTDDNHYDEYKAVRPSIAVSKSTIVEIPQTVLDNYGQPVTLGLHPKLAPLKPLFEDGNATVI
ncbi:Tat pathway signal protein, partial [Vibrio sp. DBSS07]|nr:Tat pathway signal protein [Vibrio paucivorans]